MKDYRTNYTIRHWKNTLELEGILNDMTANDWRVDSHKLSGAGVDEGWTIFMKTTTLKQPLLERSINVGEVYRILNRALEPGSDKAREFDKAIKTAVRLEGDE